MQFFIIFLIYLFLEIYLMTLFAENFGILLLFLEILLSGAIGILLIIFYKEVLKSAFLNIGQKRDVLLNLVKTGLFKVLGAMLLILPGIFTDVAGILLQFSFFTAIFSGKIVNSRFGKKDDKDMGRGEFIDVEIIEEADKVKNRESKNRKLEDQSF